MIPAGWPAPPSTTGYRQGGHAVLILTRKLEQGIVIDGQVVIRLLAIEGERIKIGVEAPRAITVLREELLREVADENQAASAASAAHDHADLACALASLARPA